MYYLYVFIVMFLVTYLPRVLPIAFFRKQIKNEFIKSFLFYVPYAVIASLTFPSIFYCCNNVLFAILGTIFAIVLSLCNRKLIEVAICSVLFVLILLLVF